MVHAKIFASPPANRSVRLHNYNNWTFGNSSEPAFLLDKRLELLAKRDRVVIAESGEWPNDVKNWRKLGPQSLKKLNPDIRVYRYYALMAKSNWDTDWDNANSKVKRMNTPLTRAEIDANDWWLRDGEGNIVKEPDGLIWYLDVGKPGFKEAWLQEALKRNAGKGFDGLVLDFMYPDITTGYFGVPGGWMRKHPMPEAYPSNTEWYETAWKPFLRYVTEGLRKAGYEVIGNCPGEYGNPDTRVVWQRSTLDGAIYEQGAVDWDGSWLPGPRVEARIKAIAGDPLSEIWFADAGLKKDLADYERKQAVSLAMYYISLPQRNDRHCYNHEYEKRTVHWQSLWDLDIGVPERPARKHPGRFFWARKFSGGLVLLNYETGETQTYTLTEVYRDHSGKIYSGQIEVPPHSALILAECDGAAGADYLRIP